MNNEGRMAYVYHATGEDVGLIISTEVVGPNYGEYYQYDILNSCGIVITVPEWDVHTLHYLRENKNEKAQEKKCSKS